MSFWRSAGGHGVIAAARSAADSVHEARVNAGEYQLLYKYLDDRYANRLVLTFAEIEDVLGFSLPPPARLQSEWWGGSDTTASRSWTLACRTATVNLSAQIVVFERQTPPAGRLRSH